MLLSHMLNCPNTSPSKKLHLAKIHLIFIDNLKAISHFKCHRKPHFAKIHLIFIEILNVISYCSTIFKLYMVTGY